MTALAAGRTEAEVTARAWDLLDRAESLPWPAEEGYDGIAAAAQLLADSLDLREEMTGLGWDDSPSLAGYGDGVARDITAQAEALAAVIGKHIGDEQAAFVRGSEGGELRWVSTARA